MTIDDELVFEMAERGAFIVPNPLVARGPRGFDTDDTTVHAGVGPTRLLISWAAPRSQGDPAVCAPASYRIESASGSSRDVAGDYRLELRLTGNTAPARAHVIDFDGQSWVRLTLEGATDGRPARIDRLTLHDASDGTDDVWLVLGDELAREGLVPRDEAGFAELVHERYPGYFPALIDETREGERPNATLARLPDLLEAHPYARRVAIAFGLALTGADLDALAKLVTRLTESDRSVALGPSLLATGPRAALQFHREVRALAVCQRLLPGPDLGAWFRAHPEQLANDGRPTPEGCRAMRHLWADALDVLYVPQ
jgi:hypothetical protein